MDIAGVSSRMKRRWPFENINRMKSVGYSTECCQRSIHLRFSEVDFCINSGGWFAFVCPHCKTLRAVRVKSCVARVEADAVEALPTKMEE
jgi:hypothetical protein